MAFIQPKDGTRVVHAHSLCIYRHHINGLFVKQQFMPVLRRVDGNDWSAPEPLLTLAADEITNVASMEAAFEYTLNKRIMNADYYLQIYKQSDSERYSDLLTTIFGVRRDNELPARDAKANALIARYDALPGNGEPARERRNLMREFWKDAFFSGLEIWCGKRGSGFADFAANPTVQTIALQQADHASRLREEVMQMIQSSDPTTRVLIGAIAPLIIISDQPLQSISGFNVKSTDPPPTALASIGQVHLYRDRILLRRDGMMRAWPEESSHLITERLGFIHDPEVLKAVTALCNFPRYEKARKVLLDECAKADKSQHYFENLKGQEVTTFTVAEMLEEVEQVARGHMQQVIEKQNGKKLRSEVLFSKINPQMKVFGEVWDIVKTVIEAKHRMAFQTVLRNRGVEAAREYADEVGFVMPIGQWQKEVTERAETPGQEQTKPRP